MNVSLSDSAFLNKKGIVLLTLWILCSNAIADVDEKIQSASSLMESGDLQGARKMLQDALAENPQAGPAHLLLGQVAFQQFQWDEAESHLKAATTLATRRPQLPWQLLGRLYLLKHDYADALAAFNQSLQLEPNFSPAFMGRARARLFLNQIDDAITDLKQVKNFTEADYLYAQILLLRDQNEEAKALLRAMPADFDAGQWLLKAIEKSTEAELAGIVGQNLGTSEAYFALAVYYRDHGNLKKFRSLLQIAFQLDDQNPAPLLFLKANITKPSLPHPELVQRIGEAKKLLDEGNLQEAQRTAREAVSACDHCVPAYLVLIDVSEKQNKLWDLIDQYQQMEAWFPDLPAVLTRIADVERKMGAFELAECTMRRALSVDPQNGALYYTLASIQSEDKKADAAIESCNKTIALGYEKSSVYLLLGDLYYQKMQLPDSVAAMEKAIKLDPQSAENMASFALSALATANYPELQALLEKNVQTHPDSINTIYALGLMYLNQQNLPKAKESFERLQKLVPRNSQVYYNLGLIYSRDGNQADAANAMNRFRELKAEELKDFNAANEAYRMRDAAQEALKAGDSANAIGLFSQILSSQHSEDSDLIGLARAYQLQKDYENAYSCYAKASTRLLANKDVLTGLMETARALGKKEIMDQCQHRLDLLSKGCEWSDDSSRH